MIGGGGTVAETPCHNDSIPHPAPNQSRPWRHRVFCHRHGRRGAVAVAGVGNERTIACTDNEAIDISG